MMKYNEILPYKRKIKIRQSKVMLKNYWPALIAIGLVTVYLIYSFINILLRNLDIISVYHNYIFNFLCLIILLNTFLNTKIPLEFHPASMIFFSGFNFRKAFIKPSLIKKILLYGMLSLMIGYMLSTFKINLMMAQISIAMWDVLMISLFTRYIFYHKGKKIKILLIFIIYIMLLTIQLYTSIYISLLVLFLLTMGVFRLIDIIFKTKLNFDKSYEELAFMNKVNYLARHSIVMDMQQVNREHMAQKARKRTFNRELTKDNALYQKNILSFSRLNTSVLFMLLAIQLIVIVLYRVKVFESIMFINELNLAKPIIVLFTSIFVMNFYDLLIKQKELLMIKSREGLYLPYSKSSIIKPFIFLGIPVLIIDTFLIGIILNRQIYIIMFATIFYIGLLTMAMYLKGESKMNAKSFVLNILILVTSYFLVGG